MIWLLLTVLWVGRRDYHGNGTGSPVAPAKGSVAEAETTEMYFLMSGVWKSEIKELAGRVASL